MNDSTNSIERYEKEVVEWRKRGRSLQEIADQLAALGVETDRFRVDRFLRKLGIGPAHKKMKPIISAAEDTTAGGDGTGARDVAIATEAEPPVIGPEAIAPAVQPPVAMVAGMDGDEVVTVVDRGDGQWPLFPALNVMSDLPAVEVGIFAEAPECVAPAVPQPKAPVEMAPVAVRFHGIDAKRAEILSFLVAGCTAEQTWAVVQEHMHVQCTREQMEGYAEGVIQETYPLGAIQKELLEVREPEREWRNEDPVVWFGPEGGGDYHSVHDLSSGVIVFGEPGSGKTTGVAYTYLARALRAGAGAVLMVTKDGEGDELLRLAELTGRADDTIVMQPGGYARINVLQYLQQLHQGAVGELVEDIVTFVRTLGSIVPKNGSGEESGFWLLSQDQHIRMAATLAIQAGAPLSFDLIAELTSNAIPGSGDGASRTLLADLIARADINTGRSPESRRLFEVTRQYFTQVWAGMPDGTRGCIVQGVMAVVSPLRSAASHQLLSTYTTWTPECAMNGRLLVMDLSPARMGGAGVAIQAAVKFVLQKAMLRRPDGRRGSRVRPVLLYADEYQVHASAHDPEVQPLARQCRLWHIALTQNVDNLVAKYGGGADAQAKVHAILGGVNTRIFLANNSLATNDYASQLIGSDERIVTGKSTTPPVYQGWDPLKRMLHSITGRPTVTHSENVQREPVIYPHEFSMLRPPSAECDVAESIVVQSGRVFSNGLRYLRMGFKQTFLTRPQ